MVEISQFIDAFVFCVPANDKGIPNQSRRLNLRRTLVKAVNPGGVANLVGGGVNAIINAMWNAISQPNTDNDDDDNLPAPRDVLTGLSAFGYHAFNPLRRLSCHYAALSHPHCLFFSAAFCALTGGKAADWMNGLPYMASARPAYKTHKTKQTRLRAPSGVMVADATPLLPTSAEPPKKVEELSCCDTSAQKGVEAVTKPKTAAPMAPATKSKYAVQPANSMGGVESDQSGLKTLSVLATRPPPEVERPPRIICIIVLERIAGLVWPDAERTAPDIGNVRIKASKRMTRGSSRCGGGRLVVGTRVDNKIWTDR